MQRLMQRNINWQVLGQGSAREAVTKRRPGSLERQSRTVVHKQDKVVHV